MSSLKILKSLLLISILLTVLFHTWLAYHHNMLLNSHRKQSDHFIVGAQPQVQTQENIVVHNISVGGNVSLFHRLNHLLSSNNRSLQVTAPTKQEQSTDGTNSSIRGTRNHLYTQSTTAPPITATWASEAENESERERMGYVVSVSFWDQQTYSVGNILSLQCWAARADLGAVVEPFMINSKFGAPISAQSRAHNTTTVPLSSLYDLEHWNNYSKRRKYSSLVSWERFLNYAPRSAVLVELKPIHKKSCSLEALRNEYLELLTPHGFRFVKEICFEYTIGGSLNKMSLDKFNRLVLGNHTSQEVSVIFTEWSGMTVSGIVELESCKSFHSSFDVIAPSHKVQEEADDYIAKYLGKRGFTAVMLRVEWLVMNIHRESVGPMIESCLRRTLERLKALQNQTGLNSTFVAIDVGKYGSKTNQRLELNEVVHPLNQFLQMIYGKSTSVERWEETFDVQEDIRSPGYVGFLQKVIATQGKCLLLTGYGTFQRHALSMYQARHKQTGDACFAITDTKCQIKTFDGIPVQFN